MKMDIIERSIVCGKNNGSTFLDAIRVDPKTKKCKDGYVACSKFTSPENTVCVPSTSDKKECPITKIEFVDKS